MATGSTMQTATIDLTNKGQTHRFVVTNSDFASVQLVQRHAIASATADVDIMRSNDGINFYALETPITMTAPGMTSAISTRAFYYLGIVNQTSGATAGLWEAFVCTKSANAD